MTVAGAVPVVASWTEPEGIAPRGTVLVVPGRGEHAGVYERLGRRIAADGYRVWAVSDPTVDETRTLGQVRELLDSVPSAEAGGAGPRPRVLVGSDTGALFAAGLVASGAVASGPDGVEGLVLAGLTLGDAAALPDWTTEVEARTACPTHQGRLSADPALRRGAVGERAPRAWTGRAAPAAIGVPVLGLHGEADAISPRAGVLDWYRAVPDVELVTVSGGRHDALNDQTHRTAAATLVLYLERLRAGVPALAVHEQVR